jgi:hypothetical protein
MPSTPLCAGRVRKMPFRRGEPANGCRQRKAARTVRARRRTQRSAGFPRRLGVGDCMNPPVGMRGGDGGERGESYGRHARGLFPSRARGSGKLLHRDTGRRQSRYRGGQRRLLVRRLRMRPREGKRRSVPLSVPDGVRSPCRALCIPVPRLSYLHIPRRSRDRPAPAGAQRAEPALQQGEPVAFGDGQDVPRLVAGLPDAACTARPPACEFGALGAAGALTSVCSRDFPHRALALRLRMCVGCGPRNPGRGPVSSVPSCLRPRTTPSRTSHRNLASQRFGINSAEHTVTAAARH